MLVRQPPLRRIQPAYVQLAVGRRLVELAEPHCDITADDVTGFKQAADRSARALSSEPDRVVQHALVERLLAADR